MLIFLQIGGFVSAQRYRTISYNSVRIGKFRMSFLIVNRFKAFSEYLIYGKSFDPKTHCTGLL